MPAVLNRISKQAPQKPEPQRRPKTVHKAVAILALIALALQTSLVLISLFEPPLSYEIRDAGAEPLDSDEFLRILPAVTWGWQSDDNQVRYSPMESNSTQRSSRPSKRRSASFTSSATSFSAAELPTNLSKR